ncbi:MAG TPA: ATP-dependent DNA ligase [Gemmatimonadales bacterium]|nr:ATP-dependent DNA ligase [Gemmatimonadales bacterium]
MTFARLVDTSRRVADTRGRRAKIALLAELLRTLPPEELEIGVAYLSGMVLQAKLGVGWATIQAALPGSAVEASDVTLTEVDETLGRIVQASGPGSSANRQRLLRDLLLRLTEPQQRFLGGLLVGELRQGALEGLVLEAVAQAAGLPAREVRRAAMMAGELPPVAHAALTGGAAALGAFAMQLFQPVQPMLAGTAESEAEAVAELGECGLELKLDGARVQIHRRGDEVRVYSRRLNEVTPAVPELVERARSLPARELILEGEAIALRADGTPHPFQTTMRRFGRRLEVEQIRDSLPLTLFLFDLLFLDGVSLIDRPYRERIALLDQAAPADLVVRRLITGSADAATAFLRQALDQGHEGIMAKALDAPYEAGHRGRHWLKVKPVRTLDLVVLAAEWGHGRRKGWLSNLHLGARDEATGGFVMLGKTFKGMTDEMLAWQTTRLLELEEARDGHVVWVRPDLVVEVAFNDLQASPQYPGGLALRFARIKGYRPDKSPGDADTITTLREIWHRQSGERGETT